MSAADKALDRLKLAAIVVADVLDAGDRDPTWHEAQELETAAIEYGRAVRESQRLERARLIDSMDRLASEFQSEFDRGEISAEDLKDGIETIQRHRDGVMRGGE